MRQKQEQKNTNSKIENYICTRPKLAGLLMQQGFEPELIHNPFNASLSAWLFPMDEDLAAIVGRYYEEVVRKPVPATVEKVLNGMKKAGNN